ncbi:hypothetical protein PIB30_082538 [Stylosanthes scabra]|uniref:Putative plant transposon protein domain-containing protein n=1 Tax=Stylosanthes scabra TaxID=79078 RepID=A0ABU6RS69_9FABA|nr:hypothetical protein [Stylosanthes scabra]
MISATRRCKINLDFFEFFPLEAHGSWLEIEGVFEDVFGGLGMFETWMRIEVYKGLLLVTLDRITKGNWVQLWGGFSIHRDQFREFPKTGSPGAFWKANKDYRLEHVLEDLCIEGADWVRHKDGRPHYLRRADLEPMTKGWYDFVCRSILLTTNRFELTVERAVLIHSIIIGENINVEEIIANQIYKIIYKTDLSSSLPFPSIIAVLCADAKVPAIKDDTLIPQEPPIMGVAMTRTRETRARNPRSQIYRRLDNQQEESRKSFEAINQRMDRMDDQLSFLCYSNQMVNETMYFPYQNTARQFREMEAQGIPVTIANLAIHRHKEEEMNQERMRHDQMVQEATAERAREANKGKAREVVPDSEEEEDSEELASSAFEEWSV